MCLFVEFICDSLHTRFLFNVISCVGSKVCISSRTFIANKSLLTWVWTDIRNCLLPESESRVQQPVFVAIVNKSFYKKLEKPFDFLSVRNFLNSLSGITLYSSPVSDQENGFHTSLYK